MENCAEIVEALEGLRSTIAISGFSLMVMMFAILLVMAFGNR